MVIKALIPYQRTISTQKLKLLGEVPGYDLYYSLLLNIYINKKKIEGMSFHDACFEEIRIHVLKQKHTHIYYKSEFSVFSFMVRKPMGGMNLLDRRKNREKLSRFWKLGV